MKTSISIPDELFEAADRAALRLGMSRSELYANAVREYVERYGREPITERLNAVYGDDSSISDVDPVLARLQSESMPREKS